MQRKIAPDKVECGMYVVRFGGAWFDHPFWRGKFLVGTPAELDKIARSNVSYVVIDEKLGRPAKLPAPQTPANDGAAITAADRLASGPNSGRGLYKTPRRSDPREAARRSASALTERSRGTLQNLFGTLKQTGSINTEPLNQVLEDVIDQVEADAKALISVTRLKTKDDYTYMHSLSVCALMVAMAQLRGLERSDIRNLGMAGLLHDIGKVGVPDAVLNKPGRLTDEEFAAVRGHPEHGYRLLRDAPGITQVALDVVRHHHEKIDGSGYPFGLSGEELTLAARMGAVCDVFDALTSNRAYKEAWPWQEALARMWSWEGHLDRTLMEDLMHVLHTFPKGLLVRLSNGMLALTETQNVHGNAANATVFYSIDRSDWTVPRSLQIAKGDPKLQIVGIEEPNDWGFSDEETIRARIGQVQ